MAAPIMPGADPFSVEGGPEGVLLIHGFGGSPFAMRPTAERLAAKGFTVEVPLLPGHGTAIEDLLPLGWVDWSSAAEVVYERLSARCQRVAVVGHSMGGTLSCWLAERHPAIRGIAVVNPLVEPFDDELRSGARALLDAGTTVWPGDVPDIADPTVVTPGYEGTPIGAFLSLNEGAEEVALGLDRIKCPVLVISSRVDHVVPPVNGDLLVSSVSGQSERLWLERSYHSAMLDYDREELEASIEGFVVSVTAPEPGEEET